MARSLRSRPRGPLWVFAWRFNGWPVLELSTEYLEIIVGPRSLAWTPRFVSLRWL